MNVPDWRAHSRYLPAICRAQSVPLLMNGTAGCPERGKEGPKGEEAHQVWPLNTTQRSRQILSEDRCPGIMTGLMF
jgi:hypothetical protein